MVKPENRWKIAISCYNVNLCTLLILYKMIEHFSKQCLILIMEESEDFSFLHRDSANFHLSIDVGEAFAVYKYLNMTLSFLTCCIFRWIKRISCITLKQGLNLILQRN
jgi:hypothetical protein